MENPNVNPAVKETKMQYNLSIQSEDFAFLIEAIKLRALSMIESLESQRNNIVRQMLAEPTPSEVVKEAIKKKVIPQKKTKKRRGRPIKAPF